jgi:long-chain acyl-CoA synthetase
LIAEDFTCENGLLTPTLKLKRDAVVKRYQAKLDALYAEEERAPAAASRPSTTTTGESRPTAPRT